MKKTLRFMLPIIVIVVLCSVLFAACAPKDSAYKVTYVSGDTSATGTVPTEQNHAEGEKFTIAQNSLTLSGKKFMGWTFDGKTYQAGDEFTMPAKDVTFTAKWAQAYTLTFAKGAGTGETVQGDDIKAESYAQGEKIILTEPAWVNGAKAFDCWTDGTTDYQAGDEYTMPSANTTLTAKWVQGYRITFAFNEDDMAPEAAPNPDNYVNGTLPTDAKYYKAGAKVTLPDGTGLTYVKHTFMGWKATNLTPEDDNVYEANGQFTMPAADVTFEAVFVVTKYHISVDFDGGTLKTGGTQLVIEDHAEGDKFQLPFALDAKDYILGTESKRIESWIIDDTPYSSGAYFTMPDSDVTVKAVWADAYRFIYKNGDDTVEDDSLWLPGERATVKAGHDVFTSVTGKKFSEWTLGTSSVNSDYLIPNNINADIELTAVWLDNAFNVSYEKGVDAAKGDVPVDRAGYLDKDSITMPENTLTYDGHIFLGWQLKNSEDTKLYLPGKNYYVDGPTANYTFVAAWGDLIKAGTWKSTDNKTLTIDIGIDYDRDSMYPNNVPNEYKITMNYDNKNVVLTFNTTTSSWEGKSDNVVYSLTIANNKLTLKTKEGESAEVTKEFGTFAETQGIPDEILGIWSISTTQLKLEKTKDNKLKFTYSSGINFYSGELTQYSTDRYMYAWKGTYDRQGGVNATIVYTKLNKAKNDYTVANGILFIEDYFVQSLSGNVYSTSYVSFFDYVDRSTAEQMEKFEGIWANEGDNDKLNLLRVGINSNKLDVEYTPIDGEVISLSFAYENNGWVAKKGDTTYKIGLNDAGTELTFTIGETSAVYNKAVGEAFDLMGTWSYSGGDMMHATTYTLTIVALSENSFKATCTENKSSTTTTLMQDIVFTKYNDVWSASDEDNDTDYLIDYKNNKLTLIIGDVSYSPFAKKA